MKRAGKINLPALFIGINITDVTANFFEI